MEAQAALRAFHTCFLLSQWPPEEDWYICPVLQGWLLPSRHSLRGQALRQAQVIVIVQGGMDLQRPEIAAAWCGQGGQGYYRMSFRGRAVLDRDEKVSTRVGGRCEHRTGVAFGMTVLRCWAVRKGLVLGMLAAAAVGQARLWQVTEVTGGGHGGATTSLSGVQWC